LLTPSARTATTFSGSGRLDASSTPFHRHIAAELERPAGLQAVARSDRAWFVPLRNRGQRGSNALSRTGTDASATSATMLTRLEAGGHARPLLAVTGFPRGLPQADFSGQGHRA